MRRTSKRGRQGFTLIELLTVVAVILILVGLIMTAVYSAQEAGRITSCRNNLGQLHKLILQYTTTYGNYLPAFWHERWVGELGLAGGNWPPGNKPHDGEFRAKIKNESGDTVTVDDYEVPQVWNNLSSPNPVGGVVDRSGAPILTCPSDASKYHCDQGVDVSYMGLAKYGWWHRGGDLFYTNKPTLSYHQLQEFGNFSNSLMLAETEPGTWQLGGCGCRWHAYRHPVKLLNRHYGGGNALMFDGHIELCKGNRSREVTWIDKNQGQLTATRTDNYIRYWEPDYDQTDPGW